MTIRNAVIAGWTGRDQRAVEKHIAELERLGVARPPAAPIFYRVSAARITSAATIQVSGDASSGEVEFVLLQSDGRLWVGAASDHTDRKVETYDVTVAKQMCEKPVAAEFWPYEAVRPHWDELILRSFIREGNERVLYQEGSVASMRHPDDLLARYAAGRKLDEGTILFGGTLAVRGEIRPAETFECELEDPVLNRLIHHRYSVLRLPLTEQGFRPEEQADAHEQAAS